MLNFKIYSDRDELYLSDAWSLIFVWIFFHIFHKCVVVLYDILHGYVGLKKLSMSSPSHKVGRWKDIFVDWVDTKMVVVELKANVFLFSKFLAKNIFKKFYTTQVFSDKKKTTLIINNY